MPFSGIIKAVQWPQLLRCHAVVTARKRKERSWQSPATLHSDKAIGAPAVTCVVAAGTKMVHVGKNTRSRIVSKGISAGNSVNAYRGLVQIQPTARGESHYV